MEKAFDELVNSFVENKLGLSSLFLTPDHIKLLKANIAVLQASDSFQKAGTSNKSVVHNAEVRSDKIYWLDRANNNLSENQFLDLIDAFVLYLNRNCFTGINDYEFHYTHYDIGSFYTKHLDQFKTNTSRKFSMIFYLNDLWESGDGGELCIHHTDNSIQLIAPIAGISVFFDSSSLVHEVLKTLQPRMSITGWLKVSAI